MSTALVMACQKPVLAGEPVARHANSMRRGQGQCMVAALVLFGCGSSQGAAESDAATTAITSTSSASGSGSTGSGGANSPATSSSGSHSTSAVSGASSTAAANTSGGGGPGTASTAAGATTGGPATGPLLAGCQVFPADNPWNTDVSGYPVHADSDTFVDSIGRDVHLHPDFGTEWEGSPIGIPYTTVRADQALVPVSFDYADESDPGPYPIPPDAPIEGGPQSSGDRHVLIVETDNCMLYELFAAVPLAGGSSWQAGSGAIFDLGSNELRPDRWTSADAAGLPILPGLVRYEEVVEQGEILHALRFTVAQSQAAYITPATHAASDSDDPALPPMGLRLRMKATHDCGGYSHEVQVICAALKRFGMFVADNGSNWYVSGAHDPRWSDDNLGDLKRITGDAFEAVETGPSTPW